MDSLTRTIQIHRPPLQTERRSRAVPVAVADASCEFPSASDKLLKGLSSLPPPDPLIRCIYVSKRPLVDGLSSAAYVSPAASLLETVQVRCHILIKTLLHSHSYAPHHILMHSSALAKNMNFFFLLSSQSRVN